MFKEQIKQAFVFCFTCSIARCDPSCMRHSNSALSWLTRCRFSHDATEALVGCGYGDGRDGVWRRLLDNRCNTKIYIKLLLFRVHVFKGMTG